VRKGTRGFDHIAFRVKDLDKTAEFLKKKGAKFSTAPGVNARGVKLAYIEGPDGIHIELLERS
jgi:lactoylglutathione lyase